MNFKGLTFYLCRANPSKTPFYCLQISKIGQNTEGVFQVKSEKKNQPKGN